ncbi:MAG: Acetyl esterase/lipase [Chloroflexi bacterium]|nr:MAG: Acetyl esterase/lipase [Chloroflexota bacterium]
MSENNEAIHPVPPAGGEDIEITRDLIFAVHDGVELKGDLYTPAGPGPFPTLALFYGGGWQRGSKEQWARWATFLAQHGIAAFALSYRLSAPGKPTFYESLHDVRCGVQYLRGRAAEIKVDPERIGGMGTSAGAHLLAMLALAGDNEAFADSTDNDPYSQLSAKVNVAICVAGIYDVIKHWEHDQLTRPNDHITEKFLGGTPMNLRELFYLASPIYHASTQNARGTKWLVSYGTQDDVVDHREQSEALVHHLKRAGALVRPLAMEGANHFWLGDTGPEEGRFNPIFGAELLLFLQNWSGWGPSAH